MHHGNHAPQPDFHGALSFKPSLQLQDSMYKLCFRSAMLVTMHVFLLIGWPVTTCTAFETISRPDKPNVILVHGYGNILAPGSSIMQNIMTQYYWKTWLEEAFHDVEVKYINWDSTQRIESQFKTIVSQFNTHLTDGHCEHGCIAVTHSTGGLVIDMLLSRALESRGKANDFSPIWDATIFSINIASAAGGIGLASTLTDTVMGNCNSLITTLLPFVECGKPASLGAGHDLRPNEARSINHSDNVRTVSFMIAGGGNMAPDLISSQLMGNNDGLVAMHSSCGGNRYPFSGHTAPESCSPFQAADGSIRPQRAPALYRQHYPIIMTEEGHLSQLYRNLLNFDYLKEKKESLIFYNEDGKIIPPPKSRQSAAVAVPRITDTKDRHLPAVVGELFGLRSEREPIHAPRVKTHGSKDDFRRAVRSITTAYAKSLRYPLFSRPLYDTDYSLLHPNNFIVEHKFFNNRSYSAAIVLPQYVLFKGSEIPVTLQLTNYDDTPLPEITSAAAEILDGNGITVLTKHLKLQNSTRQEKIFQASLKISNEIDAILPDDMNLKVTFNNASGKRQVLTTMFRYVQSVGTILNKGPEKIDGQYLIIPITVNVVKKGDYKLTANLLSLFDEEPIAHLIGENLISGPAGIIELRVDSSVLRLKNNPGPYILKDFTLSRVPGSFLEKRMSGNCSSMDFFIKKRNLDSYEAVQYSDPFEQKKLQKLKHFFNY